MNTRIYITGASGTGKTTLATELSKELNFPLVGECAREVLAEMGCNSPRDIPQGGFVEFQNRILQEKIKQCQQHKRFVADRTFIDSLVYASLHYHDFTDDEFLSYAEEVVDAQDCFGGTIFYLPTNIPLVDDGCRTQHKSGQIVQDALLRGWYSRVELWLYPIETRNIESRVKEVKMIMGY